ncbi:MAG: Hsp20/alpha crystallin family protein [Candidatus Shapirobacteria bacterium]|nr:Hsp20/alpha crystallin family protein [Candidatus Shapirobacteria bacterium]
MLKVKRSFLEKLTGAKSIENESFGQENEAESQPISTIFKEENEFAMTPTFERSVREETPIADGSEGQLTIDVYQTDNDIVIKSTIAGVKPEDLDVSINNDMVTIRGERKNEEQVLEDSYYYQECYWGSFSRSVILPVDIIAEKAEASMKNGILTIRLPKADSNKTKKIQVRGF